ncbi:TPA: hypothetical protein ACF3WL_007173, partial [Pseudomonas aeruginosa]
MPSLKARAVIFLLKHRHWFRLKARRESITFDTSIPALRGVCQRLKPGRAMVRSLASRPKPVAASVADIERLLWCYPSPHWRTDTASGR